MDSQDHHVERLPDYFHWFERLLREWVGDPAETKSSEPGSNSTRARVPNSYSGCRRSGSAATPVKSALDVGLLLDRWPVDLGKSRYVVLFRPRTPVPASSGRAHQQTSYSLLRYLLLEAAEAAIRINPHWLRRYLDRLTPRVRSV